MESGYSLIVTAKIKYKIKIKYFLAGRVYSVSTEEETRCVMSPIFTGISCDIRHGKFKGCFVY